MPDTCLDQFTDVAFGLLEYDMIGRLLVNHSPYWLLWPLGCENILYSLFKGAPSARRARRPGPRSAS